MGSESFGVFLSKYWNLKTGLCYIEMQDIEMKREILYMVGK